MAATLPGDQDLIRDRQNRLLEDQQRRLEQLKELPGKEARPEAPAAPVDSRCFPIQTIELQGPTTCLPLNASVCSNRTPVNAWASHNSTPCSKTSPTSTSTRA